MKKNYYKYLVTLFLSALFVISAPTLANTGDESPEVRFIRIAAEKGDAEAQYHLALAYDSGDGVALDHAQAVAWYQKSADQGYVDAMFNLAVSYKEGEGIEQNPEMAVLWYTKAAEAGDSDAQNNLAVMLEDGDGVDTDYSAALEWYKKSAIQGNSLAQYNLADFYLNGHDNAEPKEVEAYAWFAVAAENQEQGAAKRANTLLKQLSEEKQQEAKELAEKYIELYVNTEE